jgi:hypothetical protein
MKFSYIPPRLVQWYDGEYTVISASEVAVLEAAHCCDREAPARPRIAEKTPCTA